MYGRADGMPSFQLTVAVRACFVKHYQYQFPDTGDDQRNHSFR